MNEKCASLCHSTCRTLLELLIFLFPPLPGLEDAPKGGQLAVAADGWSADAGHQAASPQHPLLLHQLYCSDREDGEEGKEREESWYRRTKLGKGGRGDQAKCVLQWVR